MAEANSYPIFEPNQVLNHNHLNVLRDYLEVQSRLTRCSLIGTGISCGFDIYVNTQNHVTISKGCGITSQGYLVCLDGSATFTHYKIYTDPSQYLPFTSLTSDIQVLLPKSENGASELTSDNFLDDKVVVAFVEYEDNKVDTCLAQDCDEQGTWRDFHLRFLLITKEDAIILLKNNNTDLTDVNTSAELAGILNKKYRLDDLTIKRVSCLTAKEDLESKNFNSFALLYVKAMSEVLKNIYNAIENTYDTFYPILSRIAKNGKLHTVLQRINDLQKYSDEILTKKQKMPPMVQYYYDFVKDLISAHNEFIDVAFDLIEDCCPDRDLFPRHLLLGEAKGIEKCEPSVFRHHFKQPPIYNGNSLRLKETVRLFQRIVLMLEKSTLLEKLGNELSVLGDEIKITPSKGPAAPLSQRAIPYYYHISQTHESLYEYWSFDKYRKCKADLNLSYHSSMYSKKEFINNPLCYCLDEYPFFRIEGHIGKDAQEVFKKIDSIRKSQNLPFELMMLYDGSKPLPVSDVFYVYEDLQVDYTKWRNKLLLFLNNIIILTYNLERHLPAGKIFREGLRKAGDDIFSSFSLAVLNNARKKIAEQPAYKTTDNISMVKMEKATEIYGMEKDMNFASIALKNIKMMNNLFTGKYADISTENINAAGIGDLTGAASPNEANYISHDDKFILDTVKNLHECLTGLIKSLVLDLKDFQFKEFYRYYHCCLTMNISIMKYLAQSYSRQETGENGVPPLEIFCWIHHVLSAVAIYPYIDIRVLLDNLEQRKSDTSVARNFFEFRKDNIGMEHHAGVYKGGTFILVYSSEKETKGKIIGDFHVPYMGCCKKGEQKAVAKSLTPLVLPVCAVIEPSGRDDEQGLSYTEKNIPLLNNVYDPNEFEPVLISEPVFGKAEFKDKIYEPDQELTKKVIQYQVNVKAVNKELELDKTKSVIIDEFKYAIQKVSDGTTVGESAITVFIFAQLRTELKETATLDGYVTYKGEYPVENATVSDENKHITKTDDKGYYSMEVYTGTNKIAVIADRFQSKTLSVEAIAGKKNELNFDLSITGTSLVNVEKFKELNDAMGITYGSLKASEVIKSWDDRTKKYEEKIELLKDDESLSPGTPIYNVAETLERFVTDKEINIVKINNEYSEKRDQLFESIQKSSGKEKVLQIEAYRTLTMAYIERLALEQPKKFSSTTKTTLARTLEQMKKEPELDMEKEISEWSIQVDENVPDIFISNIRKELFRT